MSYEVTKLFALNGHDESGRYVGNIGYFETRDAAETECLGRAMQANIEQYGRSVSCWLEISPHNAIRIFDSPKDIFFILGRPEPVEVK